MDIVTFDEGKSWRCADDVVVVSVDRETFEKLEAGKSPEELELYGKPLWKLLKQAQTVKDIRRAMRKAIKTMTRVL